MKYNFWIFTLDTKVASFWALFPQIAHLISVIIGALFLTAWKTTLYLHNLEPSLHTLTIRFQFVISFPKNKYSICYADSFSVRNLRCSVFNGRQGCWSMVIDWEKLMSRKKYFKETHYHHHCLSLHWFLCHQYSITQAMVNKHQNHLPGYSSSFTWTIWSSMEK